MANPEQMGEMIDPLEVERQAGMLRIAGTYFDPEAVTDLTELYKTDDERLGYVYGRLLEMGEDPDTVLRQCGITEESDEV